MLVFLPGWGSEGRDEDPVMLPVLAPHISTQSLLLSLRHADPGQAEAARTPGGTDRPHRTAPQRRAALRCRLSRRHIRPLTRMSVSSDKARSPWTRLL